MRVACRPSLRRLATIDRLIRSGKYPYAQTVAAELGVHPRTIHRDLEFLQDSFSAPLAFCRRRDGYYYRDRDYALPLMRLTGAERVALFLAERLLQEYRGTPYAANLAAAFRKLTVSLTDEVTIDLSHLAEVISFRQHATTAGDIHRFAHLSRAAKDGRQLQLVYWTASRDETCRRVVDPYHLASVDGDWFLIAYCHLREDVRMFVPGRIQSMRETGVHVESPADFRVQDYLDVSFRAVRGTGAARRVRLRFAPEAARYVGERTCYPTQRIRERRDGSLELSLRVNHLLEVKRGVLSYGAACEVLEPGELQEAVSGELRANLGRYHAARGKGQEPC